MQAVILFCISLAVAVAFPSRSHQRIVGGSLTNIEQYPHTAAVLVTNNDHSWFFFTCGGSIISNVAILTAAHCLSSGFNSAIFRVRVGSSFVSSGGNVLTAHEIISHPNFNSVTLDNDIGLLRLSSVINFSQSAHAGFIAGTGYIVPENHPVWTVGWGHTELGLLSEQLRHVQVYTINQKICEQRYGIWPITNNMICSGVLDVGGRDACMGDSGGPLMHNNVIVGLTSFGVGCGHPYYPGVNTRVSQYTAWIIFNAL